MLITGISVVIPNYNGRKLLPETLPPLFTALQYSGKPYEVILSDDASTDDALDWVQTAFPQVKIIRAESNRGFSPTINRGIQQASYSHILLLNSDVKLTEQYFTPLWACFEDPDCFGVMGRIVGWDDDKIQDAAKYPSLQGAKIKTSGNYYARDPKPREALYSMYLSGANAFVSAEKIKYLQGFDEIFAPYYVEDFELSLRAWRLGWSCYYVHDAICRHRTSVTIKSKSSKSAIEEVYYRNKMFLHAIHLQDTMKVLWYFQLLPETIIRIITGRFYFLRSLSYFFRHQKQIIASRNKFLDLADKQGNLYDVRSVIKKIRTFAHQQPIQRF